MGLGRIHVASWRAAYVDLIPASVLAELSVEARAEMWRRILKATRPQLVWVAEHSHAEPRIVGFVSAQAVRDEDLDRRSVGEVYAIYTLEEVWGRGVGRALMVAALKDLRAAGFREVVLWALAGNERAGQFYQRMGFELDGARKLEAMGDATLEEVRYRRALR